MLERVDKLNKFSQDFLSLYERSMETIYFLLFFSLGVIIDYSRKNVWSFETNQGHLVNDL